MQGLGKISESLFLKCAHGGDLNAASKLLGYGSTRMIADIYYHELQGEKKSL